MKMLVFEGAGWSDADISKATIGNCRIRTAFHLDNGKPVYLEISGAEKKPKEKKAPVEYFGQISYAYEITDDEKNDDCNLHRLFHGKPPEIEYTLKSILDFVNSLGASFEFIAVDNSMTGYRAFKDKWSPKGTKCYNYGDNFEF